MVSPDATSKLKEKHIRTLERRKNFLEAELACRSWHPGQSWEKAEVAALKAAIADWREHQDNTAENARLRAQQELDFIGRMEAMRRHRDGECICDLSPESGGPEEFCPWDGRPYREVVELLHNMAAKHNEAESEVERLRAQVARVRELCPEWLAQRQDWETNTEAGMATINTLSECAMELDAALDQDGAQ